MNQIEAQNAAGVVSPASICNEDMVHFSSRDVDNSISVQYNVILIPHAFRHRTNNHYTISHADDDFGLK